MVSDVSLQHVTQFGPAAQAAQGLGVSMVRHVQVESIRPNGRKLVGQCLVQVDRFSMASFGLDRTIRLAQQRSKALRCAGKSSAVARNRRVLLLELLGKIDGPPQLGFHLVRIIDIAKPAARYREHLTQFALIIRHARKAPNEIFDNQRGSGLGAVLAA